MDIFEILEMEDQKDGSCNITLDITEEGVKLLLEYAINNLIKKQIEKQIEKEERQENVTNKSE